MPFKLDTEVAAALGALFGPNPPPPPPAGDVESRRELLIGLFGLVNKQLPAGRDVTSQDFQTKAEDGHNIICRWYTKNESPLPGSAIAYAHGGGYIGCTLEMYDEIVKRYVSRTGVPFMMIDYRLAPEVKAPTPITDAYAGLRYLVDHAQELGVDPRRIAIMGDSGGGGVTASLAHYIKLKGGPAVKKQILIYPMLDDRNTEVDQSIAPFATWTTDDNKTGWGSLLGDKLGQDGVDPIEAAGRMTVGDARGLPPTFIDVGELDLFRDEGIAYTQKLGQAGVECEFHLYPSVPHAFELFAPEAEVSRTALEHRYKAIKSV